MCFHASQKKSVPQLEQRYQAKRNQVFEIDDNHFITDHLCGLDHPEMLMIPQESPNELHPSIWGLLYKNIKGYEQNDFYKEKGQYVLNAQSEKAFIYHQYNNAIMDRRCIIPITGFFEPHYLNNKSYPYYIERKDKEAISIAGIYNNNDGVMSFTIFTKQASPFMAEIHNKKLRQPVMLTEEFEKEWLRNDLNEKQITELLSFNYTDTELHTYTVSKDVLNTRIETNYPEILNKVYYSDIENRLF